MPVALDWRAIALRLLLTVAAAALIGWNRSERGRPAGLRTTILVAAAACLAMLQVNALLEMSGKRADSFVVMDLMRLPLGILSGMGFIGAGAIVRRDSLIVGVTTAATLWFVTVLGLCFGGGQVELGLIGLGIGIATLAGLRGIEGRMKQDHEGRLEVVVDGPETRDDEICAALEAGGLRIESRALARRRGEAAREMNLTVHWRAPADRPDVPVAIRQLARCEGVVRIAWTPAPRA